MTKRQPIAPRPGVDGEFWLPVPGYETLYEVSNLGRVFGQVSYRFLSLKNSGKAYTNVALYDLAGQRITHTVHSLVAAAFLGRRPKDFVINHIDGNKQNNRIENLEYVTHSENCRHALRTGLAVVKYGESCYTRFNEQEVRQILHEFSVNEHTAQYIADMFNAPLPTIRGILKGKNWKHIRTEFDFDYKAIVARSLRRNGLTKQQLEELLHRRVVLGEARAELAKQYRVSAGFIRAREKEHAAYSKDNVRRRRSANQEV